MAFDTETLDDGTFPVEKIVDFYKKTGKLPKTSGSTPEDFIQIFEEDDKLYFFISCIVLFHINVSVSYAVFFYSDIVSGSYWKKNSSPLSGDGAICGKSPNRLRTLWKDA